MVKLVNQIGILSLVEKRSKKITFSNIFSLIALQLL